MKKLHNCGRLEVRESPVEGYGVFATDDIKAGEVLEEVPIILFPRHHTVSKNVFDTLKSNGWTPPKEIYLENLRTNLGFKDPERYYFKWHPPHQLDGDSMYTVLPMGFGAIYNTSNTKNNADWKILRDTFLFTAQKDIKKDEEITTFYGYFLGEEGTTFNCETVFHLAIDMFPCDVGDVQFCHKIKMLRFGSIETLNTQKANPAAHLIHNILIRAKDAIMIKRIALLGVKDEILVNFDVPVNIPMSVLYRRLSEANSHAAPQVRFTFTYIDKLTDENRSEDIIWKK